MPPIHEQIELLKALIALSAADGKISASERGLLCSFAGRIGIGSASLEAMIERAMSDPSARDDLFHRTMSNPQLALEMLVATARLDGNITTSERDVLIHVRGLLEISMDDFAEVYERGIQRADTLRKARYSSDS
ncbi:MAG: hypothetical protein DHS20C16_00180 [Phycisphaerae bacterium]|nr:MAG: hypothetical protein DHS20C16_00180 [Phycisphaerae bacterium]